MNKDKIIEAMAKAYYEASTDQNWNKVKKGKQVRIKNMEAAFQAFLKQLPDGVSIINSHPEKLKQYDVVSFLDRFDLYKQLLDMREEA